MLMKKIAEEVIEGKLAYEKDALYARRNQLLLEAGLRQAGVPTSKKTASVIVLSHSIDAQEQQYAGSIVNFWSQ